MRNVDIPKANCRCQALALRKWSIQICLLWGPSRTCRRCNVTKPIRVRQREIISDAISPVLLNGQCQYKHPQDCRTQPEQHTNWAVYKPSPIQTEKNVLNQILPNICSRVVECQEANDCQKATGVYQESAFVGCRSCIAITTIATSKKSKQEAAALVPRAGFGDGHVNQT